ncbi:MAG: universal stress protein [Actinobacteria bacterium]|nr:universal stress protein [Actinomycetota bacterium]
MTAEGPVIAAVSGGHMDAPVITAAALFARHERRPLLVLHVIEVGHSQALGARDPGRAASATRIVSEAQALLPRNGISVRSDVVQARAAGPAIVERAAVDGAAAIVLGAHRFLGDAECDLGFTATYVLRHATMPVTLCYDPIR